MVCQKGVKHVIGIVLLILFIHMCKLLSAYPFVSMYEKFVPNVDYSPDTFKIINKPYLEYCSKKFK